MAISHINTDHTGPAKLSKCSYCKGMGHTAFRCPNRPRRPLKGKRRIRSIGKVGRRWIATRHEWIQKNLPDSGVWNCHYCGVELHLNELTLDHVKSRSRHPELRFDLSNLVPACISCNVTKGSGDWKED